MRNTAIFIASGLLILTLHKSIAQSRVDTVFSTLQKLSSHAVGPYLNQVFNPADSLADLIIQHLEKRKSTISESTSSILFSYSGEYMVVQKKSFKQGYPFFKEAYRVAKKLRGFPLSLYYHKHSNLFKAIPRYDSAIFYARKMLDLSREMKNDSLEIVSLKQVGYLNYDALLYPQCIAYFKNILSKPELKQTEIRAAYNTIGLCFRNQRIYDSALYYFELSIANTNPDDKFYQGLIYGNMGDTYFLQEKYNEALPYLLTELKYSTKPRITRTALDCMNTIADLYLRLHDLNHSKIYYDSLTLYINTPQAVPLVRLNYFKLSSSYYEKRRDYKRAFEFVNRFHQLKDSLDALQNLKLSEEVNAKYDFDSQRREIELLHQQNLAQEATSRQQTFLLYGSLLILVLITGLLFVLYINHGQRKKSLTLANQHTNYVEQVNEELKVNLEEIERKNKEIIELASHLQEVNATKDKLFSIVGHDLRNPIQSLKGLLSLVTTAGITQEEFFQFSGKLKEGVEHIEFTMNNLLQWARNQMQGLQTRCSKININTLVTENINFLAASASVKSIQINNSISESIYVFADKDQLNLVIRNLISNALKFTADQGEIIVDCETKQDNTATITITDTGVGMDEETLDKLFKKNIHYTTAGTHGEKGSGLGLLLCYEMIEKNNGKLWVKSKPDSGTIFYITLPLAPFD